MILRTMPKSIKIFLLFLIAIVIALVFWWLYSSVFIGLVERGVAFTSLSYSKEQISTFTFWVYSISWFVLAIVVLLVVQRFTAWRWFHRLGRIGLYNSDMEVPTLHSIRGHRDRKKRREGWQIYRFKFCGVSDDDFTDKKGRLSGICRGRIGEITYSRNYKFIEVETHPYKAIKPFVIRYSDNSVYRQNLIDRLGFATLVVGAPNGGKTYCLLTLTSNYKGYTIVYLNTKGHDVDKLRGCLNYYEGFEAVLEGWNSIFSRLKRREMREETEAEREQKILLVFDEFQATVGRMDKKRREEFFKEFMTYIAMSRSLGFKTLIGSQGAYSDTFGGHGVRDMFSTIIAMGNLQKTAKQMLFEAEIASQLVPARRQGQGNIFHQADNSVEPIMVERMDEQAVFSFIVDALNRPLNIPENDVEKTTEDELDNKTPDFPQGAT